MPLPSSINDLSTTPASNYPAGSESPSLLDDYLRTYAAYIATLRDTQVSLTGNQTIAGTKTFSSAIVGSLSGNASTATALQTARTIWGQSFDGTANVSGALTGVSDITASGSVTLSGGTANGVPYLNGSKVLTTGSALTFDGTNLALGSGTATNLLTLAAASTPGIDFLTGASIKRGVISASSTALNFNSLTSNPITWQIDSSEQMRLTSTGLGIGTSSPASKLHVLSTGESFIISGGTTNTQYQRFNTSGGNYYIGVSSSTGTGLLGGASAYSMCLVTESARDMLFGTNNTERMRLDTSGNLGLGVTPSAWASGTIAIELPGTAVYSFNNANALYTTNSYYNGTNWLYKNSAPACQYQQVSGQHRWWIAPSGTAGNPITFTQAMTLDASGNLVIGGTSASAKLHVVGSGNNGVTTDTAIRSYSANGTAYLDVGFNGLNASSNSVALMFAFAGTERARIDSSGRLLVNLTAPLYSQTAAIQALAQSTSAGAIAAQMPNSTSGAGFSSQTVTTAGTSWYHFIGQSGNGTSITTNNVFIFGNGNIQNVNNSYGAISDLKFKENITDATPKLNDLMQVRVVNFNLKSDPEHKQIGVVAQELEQVFPGMVDETEDRDTEGNDLGTTTKSVKYSVFVPMLIKAMQEQQAMIEQIKAEFDAYKAAHP